MTETQNCKAICFTNFKLDYDYTELRQRCKYFIMGDEICPDTGRPHHQGYFELKKPTKWNTIKKLFPCANFRKRNGTPEQASRYCEKEGKVLIKEGVMDKPGKRTDLDAAYDAVEAGENQREFMAENRPNLQAVRVFEIYQNIRIPERDFMPDVYWLYGSPGSGKTRAVHDREDDLYTCGSTHKWWCGYRGQEAVLIDDIRPGWAPFEILLKILDRYACPIEVKGGKTQLCSKRMYVTSPVSPVEFVRLCSMTENPIQLTRRIKLAIDMDDNPEILMQLLPPEKVREV